MDTWCTFVFVLVVLITLHQNMRHAAVQQSREYAIAGIPIAAAYMGMLGLSGFVSANVLNPAVAMAIIVEPKFWYSFQLEAQALAEVPDRDWNKCLTPFLGGLLAGVFFLLQKKLINKHELNHMSDILRGSVNVSTDN